MAAKADAQGTRRLTALRLEMEDRRAAMYEKWEALNLTFVQTWADPVPDGNEGLVVECGELADAIRGLAEVANEYRVALDEQKAQEGKEGD